MEKKDESVQKNEDISELRRYIGLQDKENIKRLSKIFDFNKSYKELGCKYTSVEGYSENYDFIEFYLYKVKNGENQEKPVYEERETYVPYISKIYDEEFQTIFKEKYGEDIPWTPLQYAAAIGKVDSFLFLLENKSDLSIQDKTGRNALQIAKTLYNHQVVEAIEEFLDQ